MQRTLIQAGAIIALLTGTAFGQVSFAQVASAQVVLAQVAPLTDNHAPPTKKEREQNAAEDAYRAATKKVIAPEKKSLDPWGDVRATATPTPSTPPAKTKQ
jgi:hypothetical protein